MGTWKKVIQAIVTLSFILILIIVLITSDLIKYFVSVGYLTMILILLSLLFLIGVWLERGREKMTPKQQGVYDKETIGLKARENVRRKASADVRRKASADVRGRKMR